MKLKITLYTILLNRLFVASATWLAALSSGGAVTFPMVLMHQLRSEDRNNTTIHLDMETASWIGSIQGLTGIPCILVVLLMQWRGRRVAFITACFLITIGWITIYAAKDATALLIGESFHGLSSASFMAVSMTTLTEMMPPKHRHIYTQVMGIFLTGAMMFGGLMTQYLNWRTISIIMCVPAVAAVLVACMWPESHHWLAVKGEFDKCEKSFIWIRGIDKNSMKELHDLVDAQKERISSQRNRPKRKNKTLFRQVMMKFTRRDLNMPLVYMCVLQYLTYWCGGLAVLVHSVELIDKTTHYENVAQFGSLVLNGTLFVGYVFSVTILSRYVNKKTILLSAITLIVLTMTCNSVVNYLQSVNVMSKKSLLSLCFLMVFIFSFSFGILPISYLLGVELMPVRHRGVGGVITEICTSVMHTASTKLAPYLFVYINIWGTLLLYAINALVCGFIIWRFVPETTGKTLQELENYLNDGKFKRHQENITEAVTPILE